MRRKTSESMDTEKPGLVVDGQFQKQSTNG